MNNELNFIKPQVRALKPYALRMQDFRYKLNQNENPYGFPEQLKEEVWRRLRVRNWARYPDFYLREITERLAAYAGVPADWVLVGNGSNELLQMTLLATLSLGDTFVIPVPTFTLYRLQGSIMGGTAIEPRLSSVDFSLPVEEVVASIRTHRPKIVVLVSPNNPTGNTHAITDIRPIIEAATDGLVLLDEAYVEFTDQNYYPLLNDYTNVALLRTFSKAWALAGARVGYMIARPELIEQIAKIKLPYGLGILSETTALVALEHQALLFDIVAQINRQRDALFLGLQSLPGIHPYPSQANFILCRFNHPTDDIFNACAQAGILIRDVSYYPGLAGHVRLSVGTAEENQILLRTLSDFLNV